MVALSRHNLRSRMELPLVLDALVDDHVDAVDGDARRLPQCNEEPEPDLSAVSVEELNPVVALKLTSLSRLGCAANLLLVFLALP